jgi:hypothetical protein
MDYQRKDSNWIQTFTGRQFWPLAPRAEDVCIEDIAHALAMKCRYTGHCTRFYSVAQHSVLASQIVPSNDALWALLHDATEAYLPDVARPVKQEWPEFREWEDRLCAVIAEKFGLSMPMPDSIKHADLIMLRTERRDLMVTPPRAWRTDELAQPMVDHIFPLSWVPAESLFLRRFGELTGSYAAFLGEGELVKSA